MKQLGLPGSVPLLSVWNTPLMPKRRIGGQLGKPGGVRLDKMVVLLVDHAEPVLAQGLDDPLVFVVQRNMPAAGNKLVELIVGRIRYADDPLRGPLARYHGKVAAPIARDVRQRQPRRGRLEQLQAFVLAAGHLRCQIHIFPPQTSSFFEKLNPAMTAIFSRMARPRAACSV